MKIIFAQNGARKEATPDQAAGIIESGEGEIQPGPHLVRDRKGNLVELEGIRLDTALRSGARFATQDETEGELLRKEWDTTGGALATAAAEGANSLTLGGIDFLGSQMSDEYARNRVAMRSANPDAALAGRVAGELGGLALGGGLVKMGAKGLTAALVTRGANAGRLGTALGAVAKGTSGASSIAGRMGMEAAAGAAEATLFEIGQVVTEQSIGEADLSAEQIMARVGTAGALGGTFGGVLGLIAGSGKAVKNRVLAANIDGAGFMDKRVTQKAMDAANMGDLSTEGARVAQTPRTTRLADAEDAIVGGESMRRQNWKNLGTATDNVSGVESGLNAVASPEASRRQLQGLTKDLAEGGYNPEMTRSAMLTRLEALRKEWAPTPKMKAAMKADLKAMDGKIAAIEKAETAHAAGAAGAAARNAKGVSAANKKFTNATRKLDDVVAADRLKLDEAIARGDSEKVIARMESAAEARRLKAQNVIDRLEPPDRVKVTDFDGNPEDLQLLRRNRSNLRSMMQETADVGTSPLSQIEKRHIKTFQDEVDNVLHEITLLETKPHWNAKDGARIYQIMEKFKRNLNPFVADGARVSGTVKTRAERLYANLQADLTDPKLWGPKRAESAELHNRLITGYFNKRGGLKTVQQGAPKKIAGLEGQLDLGETEDLMSGFTTVKLADSKKLDTLSKRLGKAENDTYELGMREHVEGIALNNQAAHLRGSITDAQALQNDKILKKWFDTWDKNLQRPVDADSYAQVFSMYGFGLESADHLHRAANISASEVVSTAFNPTFGVLSTAATAAPKIAAHAGKYFRGMKAMNAVRTATRTAVERSARAIVLGKVASKAVRERTARAIANQGSPREEFETNTGLVNDWQADPEASLQRATNRMGPMTTSTPQTAVRFGKNLTRQMDALAEKMPVAPKRPSYMTGPPDMSRTSKTQMRKFNDFARGLGDPLSVLTKVEGGMASQDEVDGLAVGYPMLFLDVQRQVQDHLMELKDPLSYQRELRIARLFKVPMHPSLLPLRIASLQQIAREAGADEKEDDNAISPSRATSPDMAESFATRTEQIQGNVRG